MIEVEAIKDEHLIPTISLLLRKHHSEQLGDIWDFGLQVALRISDLLSIRFDQIEGDQLSITEGKTHKRAYITLNSKALEIVARIKQSNPNAVYLFQSNRARNVKTIKPISRQAVTKAFSEVGAIVGKRLGTHSMRKTRGYHQYKISHNIGSVMKMLRHSSAAITLRYIGIDQEEVSNDFKALVL